VEPGSDRLVTEASRTKILSARLGQVAIGLDRSVADGLED
jgi:hypothetical protein